MSQQKDYSAEIQFSAAFYFFVILIIYLPACIRVQDRIRGGLLPVCQWAGPRLDHALQVWQAKRHILQVCY